MNPAIIIGGAAAVGIGAVVLLRRRAAAAPEQSKCDKLADAARALGGDQAASAAKLACELANKLPLPSWDDLGKRPSAMNQDANGVVVTKMHPALWAQGYYISGHYTSGYQVNNRYGEGALSYANGCVPYTGAPGFEKCAPGTKPYGYSPGLLTGRMDWTTRKHATKDEFLKVARATGGEGLLAPYWKPYPIAVPTGHEPWWLAGKPVPRPPNTVIAIDNRTTPPTPKFIPKPTAPTGPRTPPASGQDPIISTGDDGRTVRDHRGLD